MRTKLKLVLVLASLGVLASLAMSGTASAATAGAFFDDPQTTNVPYVAWVVVQSGLELVTEPR